MRSSIRALKFPFSFLTNMRLGRYLARILANKDIRSKIFFTIFVIAMYRILANIPLPGIDMEVYQAQFGQRSTSEVNYFLTIFTGGLLDTPSIVGLGIGVYITASIVMQLLTSVIPQLEELSKEGARGRQIIDRYTRYLTVPLSFGYALGYLFIIAQQDLGTAAEPAFLIPRTADGGLSAIRLIFMATVLTGGSLLVMWLAELITERGIANGSSIMIMVGILSSVPALLLNDINNIDIGGALSKVLSGETEYLTDPGMIALYLLVVGGLLLIAGIVFVTESTRKLPIQYARRQRGAGDVQESHLPLKLNQSGVLPIIFASALMTTPRLVLPFLGQIISAESAVGQFVANLQTSFLFDSTQPAYNVVYFVVIIIFSFIYAFIALKPADVAENLQKSGAFVPGIRPGKATEQYITAVMMRLTGVGAIFLATIAMIPLLAGGALLDLTGQQFVIFSAVGGTSILIVVGVILEMVRQVESLRATQNYEKYI